MRFVPLIGAQGWTAEPTEWNGRPSLAPSRPVTLARLVREVAEPLESIDAGDLGALLERISRSRLVLLGEATHGTSEFYRMRARITQDLIRAHGFRIVAVEADWPDARRINRYVQALSDGQHPEEPAFARFPTWMWRNHETWRFIEWLRSFNAGIREPALQAGFYGLDLYSLFTSIRSVLEYLDRVDPQAARIARERYSCLTPWQADPQAYGRAAITGRYRLCEEEAVAILRDMLSRELEYAERDGERFLDAVQNARLVADAERYYRAMYHGASASWNQRDQHMFDTLETLLAFHGPASKAVVWAHNSHLGDAHATEMRARGELNVGHLCRQRYGDTAVLVGFGTDRGTVAAAHEWDQPMSVMSLRPGHPESYEWLCHESGIEAFVLPLRKPSREDIRSELAAPRLERAVGVIYRPETELQSHYFHASLPYQFDEYIWLDETQAVRPVAVGEARAPGAPSVQHRTGLMPPEVEEVLQKLDWMRDERMWPNGPRYLWTDAFGVVMLVSLGEELKDDRYVQAAEWVVAEVERVLGRPRGIRIGEALDRDGQYFHYLTMWLFALHVLADKRPAYRERAIGLVRQIHPRFVLPGVGVIWKMREDLSAPYPGFGLGALDPFHGYVVYRLLSEGELAEEIRDMQELVQRLYSDLDVRLARTSAWG